MSNDFSFSQEVFRKLFHLFILLIPALNYFLGHEDALILLAFLSGVALLIDYFRHENELIKFYVTKFFGKILRPKELEPGKLCGLTWMLLAAFIIFLLCKEMVIFCALAILAISDSVAAIFGRAFVSRPFFEKSFIGSMSFFISGLLIIFILGANFEAHFWFYVFAIMALLATTIIEARPSLFGIDDNFTIPVSFAVIVTVFDWMWGFI